jgi:hypothetical protein
MDSNSLLKKKIDEVLSTTSVLNEQDRLMGFTELLKKIKVSHKVFKQLLDVMENKNILEIYEVGKRKIIKLNRDSAETRSCLKFLENFF